MSQRLPVVFFGHGSPTNVLEDNRFTRCWSDIGAQVARAQATLMISAHWYDELTKVAVKDFPETIHDFGPLDDRLFQIRYSTRSSSHLVDLVTELIGIPENCRDIERGLDHGAWTVMMKAFPAATMPIVQLSLNMHLTPRQHYDLGARLTTLRDAGFLIACSGNIVHNLAVMDWHDVDQPFDWAISFNRSILQHIIERQHERVVHYQDIDGARKAVPHPDHFLPLLYALGASRSDDEIKVYTDEIVYKSLGMATLVFGG